MKLSQAGSKSAASEKADIFIYVIINPCLAQDFFIFFYF